MAEQEGVKETSPTPLAEAIASSPEVTEELQQTQEKETVTPKETVTQEQEEQTEVQEEEPRIPYTRFKEKVDEANYLKGLLERQLQAQQSQQQIRQPTQDPYAGMTAEQEQYARWLDGRIDQRASQIAEQKLQSVQPVIDAGRMELAQIKVGEFRRTHPDIKPNSPDELEIAQRIQVGYTPDDAYWSIMGPRGIKTAEDRGKQQVKQQIEAKKKANVESSTSIPIQVQPKPKKSWRDDFANTLKLEEEKGT